MNAEAAEAWGGRDSGGKYRLLLFTYARTQQLHHAPAHSPSSLRSLETSPLSSPLSPRRSPPVSILPLPPTRNLTGRSSRSLCEARSTLPLLRVPHRPASHGAISRSTPSFRDSPPYFIGASTERSAACRNRNRRVSR